MTFRMTFIISVLLLNLAKGFESKITYKQPKEGSKKIHITMLLKENPNSSLFLETLPIDAIGNETWNIVKASVTSNTALFSVSTIAPIRIYTGSLLQGQNKFWIAEPGDSIFISEKNGQLHFKGVGASKFKLKYELSQMKQALNKELSNSSDGKTRSLQDYLEWNNYLNNQLKYLVPLIDTYKGAISDFAYKFIRNATLDDILDDRTDKFFTFLHWATTNNMPKETICAIYDTTYAANTTLPKMPSYNDGFLGSWGFLKLHILRNAGFNKEILPAPKDRALKYYELGSKVFKGKSMQRFLAYFLTKEMIDDLGFIKETDSLLNLFFRQSTDPHYKNYVKDYQRKAKELVKGKQIPFFELINSDGEKISNQAFKGKITLYDFWFTGCNSCISMARCLSQVKEKLGNNQLVEFVSISTDKKKETWLSSIKQATYTGKTFNHFYTGGEGYNGKVIKDLNITGYPSILLADEAGKIIENPLPDPRKDSGTFLTNLIIRKVADLYDGPYIIDSGQITMAYTVEGMKVKKELLTRSSTTTTRTVLNMPNKHFIFPLKSNLNIEPSLYSQTEKIFVISDIEGNFRELVALLKMNGVIDDDFNWIFGNGHLVFNGDMFDRGKQVTEVLWLIYSLEEKAKSRNGYVHLILGNHEIMNMNGDHRYAQEKYKRNSSLIGIPYNKLYGQQTELGKWLRTKNIIEKIGDYLFVHGGIGDEVLNLGMSIEEINDIARKYYDKDSTAQRSLNHCVKTLFNKRTSPFWYRQYYLDVPKKIYVSGDTLYKTPEKTVTRVLETYHVKHVVTGHTIIADTVGTCYNGKVINVDTRHAKGTGEALIIEAGKLYRADTYGKRTPIKLPSELN